MPSIRPLTPADLEAVVALADQLGYPNTPAAVAERIAAVLPHPDHAAFVAERAGAVVGWAHVHATLFLQGSEGAELAGMVVADGERGSGVGRALLAAAEEWARERGLPVMRVRSRSTREGAHGFYRDAGYAEVKTSLTFEKPLG